jgi:hypothetical protein
MTLQEQFNSIKSGKGNKDQFLKQARQTFPQYLTKFLDFDTSVNILKSKQLINEAIGGVVTKGFNITNWKQIFEAEVKAEEKSISKEAEDANRNMYDNKNVKNADNINFNEILKGYLAELGDPKNTGKTGDELKDIVVKNLAKDCLHYTKDGMFGVKGIGFTTEAPGLGEPKAPKGKYKASGYGDIEKEVKVKANVQDSLGDKEAKDSMPKKVKEMTTTPQNSAGVKKMKMPGAEKTMKLQEGLEEISYQMGMNVGSGAGSGAGGRRFIPTNTLLSKEAFEVINAEGNRRMNFEKPHIKIIRSGENIKLQISQHLLEAIAGAQRGRFTGSALQSKSGTGITSEDLKLISPEFRKLVKTLNEKGKLAKTGEYYLLDVDTKFNPKKNVFMLPLPNQLEEGFNSSQYDNMSDEDIINWAKEDGMEDFIEYNEVGELKREELLSYLLGKEAGSEDLGDFDYDTRDKEAEHDFGPDDTDPAGGYGPSSHMESLAESKIRSVIAKIIQEELKRSNSGAEYIEINGKTVKTYTQNGDKSYSIVYDDGTKDIIPVSNDAWDEINNLHMNSK